MVVKVAHNTAADILRHVVQIRAAVLFTDAKEGTPIRESARRAVLLWRAALQLDQPELDADPREISGQPRAYKGLYHMLHLGGIARWVRD